MTILTIDDNHVLIPNGVPFDFELDGHGVVNVSQGFESIVAADGCVTAVKCEGEIRIFPLPKTGRRLSVLVGGNGKILKFELNEEIVTQ